MNSDSEANKTEGAWAPDDCGASKAAWRLYAKEKEMSALFKSLLFWTSRADDSRPRALGMVLCSPSLLRFPFCCYLPVHAEDFLSTCLHSLSDPHPHSSGTPSPGAS